MACRVHAPNDSRSGRGEGLYRRGASDHQWARPTRARLPGALSGRRLSAQGIDARWALAVPGWQGALSLSHPSLLLARHHARRCTQGGPGRAPPHRFDHGRAPHPVQVGEEHERGARFAQADHRPRCARHARRDRRRSCRAGAIDAAPRVALRPRAIAGTDRTPGDSARVAALARWYLPLRSAGRFCGATARYRALALSHRPTGRCRSQLPPAPPWNASAGATNEWQRNARSLSSASFEQWFHRGVVAVCRVVGG